MMLYIVFLALLAATLTVLLLPVWNAQDIPEPQRRRFALAIGIVFIGGAFGLYQIIGAPEILPLLAAREERMAEIKAVILKRSEEVKADPKNLAAWVELGQSFMETGQYHAAANAFRHTVLLSDGDPTLIMSYAKAQIAESDGKVTDEIKHGLEMVLMQRPSHPEARYWLAVRQLQEGKTEKAMQAMKELYHSLPADSSVKAMIDKQIGKK